MFAILAARFLDHTYETASYHQIETDQARTHGIYASATRDDFYEYKLSLYRYTHPEVVAIGSSRTWQFQALGMRVPFLTLGGAVRSLDDADRLFEDLQVSGTLPKVIIFGIDYWWMHPDYKASSDGWLAEWKAKTERWLGTYFRPAAWLYTRKIGLRTFVSTALGSRPENPPLPVGYGVAAIFDLHGFAVDGHYRYLSDAFGLVASDKGLTRARKQIDSGEGRFLFGDRASPARVAQLRALLERMRNAGVHVITFYPPVSSVVLDENARMGRRLDYIADARERLRDLVAYDFHDARVLGSSDCEFVDAYHGGEVLYLRIIDAITKTDRELADRTDRVALENAISRAAGHVLADGDAFAPRFHEQDFLGLGCAK